MQYFIVIVSWQKQKKKQKSDLIFDKMHISTALVCILSDIIIIIIIIINNK